MAGWLQCRASLCDARTRNLGDFLYVSLIKSDKCDNLVGFRVAWRKNYSFTSCRRMGDNAPAGVRRSAIDNSVRSPSLESPMQPIAGNYEIECCEQAAQMLLSLSQQAAERGAGHLAAILTSTAALLQQLREEVREDGS